MARVRRARTAKWATDQEIVELYEGLGHRLREIREGLGFTLTTFGELVGVVGQVVAKWEDGHVAIYFADLATLSTRLGIPMEHLVPGQRGAAVARRAVVPYTPIPRKPRPYVPRKHSDTS